MGETGNPSNAGKYPDLIALCGEHRFQDGRRDMLLNPLPSVGCTLSLAEAYDKVAFQPA